MKYVAILLLFMLPATVMAEPVSVSIQKGQLAPFGGILLNPEAQAKIIAEKTVIELRSRLEKEKELEKQRAKHAFDLSMRDTEKKYAEKKYEVIMGLKDKEIDTLHEQLKKNSGASRQWWLAIGTIAGVIISIAAFVTVASVSK